MKRILASLFLSLLALTGARAQTSDVWPDIITSNATYDFGNGPMKLRVIQGTAYIFSAQGGGSGGTSGSSTALTLASTPTVPPCVGCQISGTGITSGTTVVAYNGTTGVTLSAAMTVAPGTALSWGAACPATKPATYIQASAGTLYYELYTGARICGISPGGPAQFALTIPYSTGGGGGGDPNAITALTGDVTATGPGSAVATLATVNANVGSFGGPNSIPSFTVDAKGRITAASSNVPAIPFTGVTGQATLAQLPTMAANTVLSNWTGSAAVPAANTWPACAADGTHALAYVNGTGLQCVSITTGGTGTVTSVGYAAGSGLALSGTASPITGSGSFTYSLASIAADNLLANSTGSSGPPIATPIGNCSASNSALTYNTSTHAFGCNSTTTGTVTSVGYTAGAGLALSGTASPITGSGSFTYSLSSIAADNLLANSTGSLGPPIATAVPSCSSAANALTYDTSTHAFGCNTMTTGTVTSVSVTAGTGITQSGSPVTSSGAITVNVDKATNSNIYNAASNKVLTADATFGSAAGIVPLSGTSSVTPDFTTGINFSFTATSATNFTLQNPTLTSAMVGRTGCIFIQQPASGTTVSITYGTVWSAPGGSSSQVLTQTLTALDMLCYLVQSTTNIVFTISNTVFH